MADTTFAMSQVVEGGTATKVKALGRPVAGKTGSSTDNLSAWFVGFTPQLATAVAMYQPDDAGNPEPIEPFGGESQITGGTWPTTLWTSYMGVALEGYEIEDFPPRADVGNRPSPSPSPSETEEEEDEETDPPGAVVPSGLEGRTQADATAELRNLGLEVAVVEAYSADVARGRVISVSPGAGTVVEDGSEVTLTVSRGPEPTPDPTPTPTPTPDPTTPPPPKPSPSPTPSPTPTPTPTPDPTDEEEDEEGGGSGDDAEADAARGARTTSSRRGRSTG